jgi:hypothetical protein
MLNHMALSVTSHMRMPRGTVQHLQLSVGLARYHGTHRPFRREDQEGQVAMSSTLQKVLCHRHFRRRSTLGMDAALPMGWIESDKDSFPCEATICAVWTSPPHRWSRLCHHAWPDDLDRVGRRPLFVCRLSISAPPANFHYQSSPTTSFSPRRFLPLSIHDASSPCWCTGTCPHVPSVYRASSHRQLPLAEPASPLAAVGHCAYLVHRSIPALTHVGPFATRTNSRRLRHSNATSKPLCIDMHAAEICISSRRFARLIHLMSGRELTSLGLGRDRLSMQPITRVRIRETYSTTAG